MDDDARKARQLRWDEAGEGRCSDDQVTAASQRSFDARAAFVDLIAEIEAVCEKPDPLDYHVRLRAALARVKGGAA
jgi:vancomycin permeability regulator SanA